MATERLLLCRPLGGLNDICCQIEKACLYAERFDRMVIVDTAYSKTYFRDRFSSYFTSLEDRLILDTDAVSARLDELEVFPSFLAGRVTRYGVRFDRNSSWFVEDETGLIPSFDFDRDHAAPLIVHHSSGGRGHGIGALARLRLREPLVEVLLQRLARLGPGYSGIHVRNTDYKAKVTLETLVDEIDSTGPIFLATDNRDTVTQFRSIFGDERIHAFAALPSTAGERAHHIADPAQAFERNRDAILDLVMLGLASRLYLFEIEPNAYGAVHSGFSVLAAHLHNARPVLKSLLGDDPAVLAATGLTGQASPPPRPGLRSAPRGPGPARTERLLLCRPMGGLNDMLCQIENACLYAERFDRTVVVDSRHQSPLYYRDNFSSYFDSRQARLVLNADDLIGRADRLEVFPGFLAGRVTRYETDYDRPARRLLDRQTGLPIAYDPGRNYDEALLVHHATGGGAQGIDALARLRIRQPVLKVLLQRLGELGRPYLGVHVRDTDYRAKVRDETLVAKIEANRPIFLATDNRDTVARFRSLFAARVHAFASLPAEAGRQAHHIDDVADPYERNRDAILDLIMLALADRLYLFELQPNPDNAPYSGFSVLAANLHSNRPVLSALISDDESVLEAIGPGANNPVP